MEDIRKAIESNLVGFYQNHIYPKPDRDRMDFTLLIGVWLHGETRMFMTENAVVVPVNDYECIGAGAYLARYWVRQFFASEERGTHRKSPTMKDITLISTYALNSAMEYDEYCGGEAEFLVMKTNGEIGNDVSLYPFEDFPGKIHRVLWTMLRKLVHATDSVDVYGATEDFFQEVRNISEQGGKWLDHISEVLRKSIEGPEVPAVKPTPGGPLEAALGVATESTETDSP